MSETYTAKDGLMMITSEAVEDVPGKANEPRPGAKRVEPG
jgi:hypothetical protein